MTIASGSRTPHHIKDSPGPGHQRGKGHYPSPGAMSPTLSIARTADNARSRTSTIQTSARSGMRLRREPPESGGSVISARGGS